MGTHTLFAASSIVGIAAAVAACAVVSGLTQYDKELPCTTCGDAASVVSDGGPPVRCPHTFCAGFDSTMPSDGWEHFGQSNGATLLLDTQVFSSAPASLKVAVPASGGDVALASLSQSFPMSPMHVTLAFDVQLDGTAFGGQATAAAITLASIITPDPMNGGGVALVWQNGQPALLVSGTANGKLVTTAVPLAGGALPLGMWAHVVVEARFAGMAGTASAAVNGMMAAQMMNVLTPAGGSSVDLQIGLEVSGGDAPALDANFDNVAFDAM
jgi:hypothetical protein